MVLFSVVCNGPLGLLRRKRTGTGRPAASGGINLIMGDLNTDPGRVAWIDPSAERWNEFVGPGLPFHFLSETGSDAAPTYAGLFNIDHTAGDRLSGECWAAGVTENRPPVTEAVYFDHHPLVCTIEMDTGEHR